MDARICMEISPGSIQFVDCDTCGNEATTFDAVALSSEAVSYVGTITRCPTCEEGRQ